MGQKRVKGRFGMLPKAIHDSDAYRSLTPKAAKLLVDVFMQYDGRNNGDLHAAFSLLRHYGWKSKSSLHRATSELLEAGLILKTRSGGRCNRACLYAITWQAIDDIRVKQTGALKFDIPGIHPGPAPSLWRSP